jgi:glycosyltransferase involved in cell wall biosynthesis
VLYICIPAYNEAETLGLLLWRIRKVFQEYAREYEVLVYDDGSTDGTADALQPYTKVLPLTLLGDRQRIGYAGAVDALSRAVSARTRYPRRDAMITMQGDFTDQPEQLPELAKRFEGGADLVIAERSIPEGTPKAVRQLRRFSALTSRFHPRVAGVSDPYGSLRLYRISIIRDLIQASGNEPIVAGPTWAANLSMLRQAAALARRMEVVTVDPRYDLRVRATRIRPWSDGVALLRASRAAIQPRGRAPRAAKS